MRRIAIAAALGAALAACTTVAYAQDFPPVVTDLGPRYDLVEDGAIDILGVEVGMTRDDAVKAMQAAFPGAEVKDPSQDSVEISDGRGNLAGFALFVADRVEAGTIDLNAQTGQHAAMEVYYTPGLSGGRVYSVHRAVDFGQAEQPSLPEFLAALEAKYGPETASRTNDTLVENYYGWFEGARAALPDKDREKFGVFTGTEGPFSRCLTDVFNLEHYRFTTKRKDKYPGCTVVMQVSIDLGRRDDLISGIDMEITDYRRWYDSGVMADAWLIEQVTAASSDGEGAAAPAL